MNTDLFNKLKSNPSHTFTMQGYREDDGLYVESDTDEQLLIHIPFQQAVKLSSIFLKATNTEGNAPKTIKLFINQPTIGFSEATDSPGIESFDLDEQELSKGMSLVLKPVKYQRVNCLTLFVESNQGDEDTTIFNKLVILGSPGSSFDVASIKDITKEQG